MKVELSQQLEENLLFLSKALKQKAPDVVKKLTSGQSLDEQDLASLEALAKNVKGLPAMHLARPPRMLDGPNFDTNHQMLLNSTLFYLDQQVKKQQQRYEQGFHTEIIKDWSEGRMQLYEEAREQVLEDLQVVRDHLVVTPIKNDSVILEVDVDKRAEVNAAVDRLERYAIDLNRNVNCPGYFDTIHPASTAGQLRSLVAVAKGDLELAGFMLVAGNQSIGRVLQYQATDQVTIEGNPASSAYLKGAIDWVEGPDGSVICEVQYSSSMVGVINNESQMPEFYYRDLTTGQLVTTTGENHEKVFGMSKEGRLPEVINSHAQIKVENNDRQLSIKVTQLEFNVAPGVEAGKVLVTEPKEILQQENTDDLAMRPIEKR